MTQDLAALPALPILDLSLLDSSAEDASRFRAQLAKATHEIGFFYLVNTSLPPSLEARMHAAARSFFSLPLESKLAMANTNSPQFRGYTALGLERTRGAVDLREQIDICPEGVALREEELEGRETFWRLVGPNQWPESLPELRAVSEEWQAHCERISRKLLRAWALALGESEDYFERSFGDPFTLLKIVRYPPTTPSSSASSLSSGAQGVGKHKDAGVLTLLWIDGSGGLQVETPSGGWLDVPPIQNGFVVNVGEMLEYATQGYLKATSHRVTLNEGTGDRISVPYFFNPALDARLPLIQRRGLGEHKVSEDPENPIYALYGENCLKSRLRSHPDVAERYHRDLVGLRPLPA